MNEFLENLKKQASDNPVVALGVGAAVVQALTKLINTNVARENAKTYKREIDRRTKNSKK